jgi:hypothetical protein
MVSLLLGLGFYCFIRILLGFFDLHRIENINHSAANELNAPPCPDGKVAERDMVVLFARQRDLGLFKKTIA